MMVNCFVLIFLELYLYKYTDIFCKRQISVYFLTRKSHLNTSTMALPKSITAHISLLLCNIVWACDYPFYNLVLGHYITPLAMVSASLVIAAVWSLLPMLWEKHEKVEAEDRIKIFVAALLIGISRKLCMMFGLSQTSPIDGSIISTTTPLLVLILSVLIGLERFTKTKLIGLMLGMAGAVAIIISSSTTHYHSGLTGNLLIFVSSCISALYMVYFKKLVSKYRITTLLRWIYCISAIVMLPIGAHEIIETQFDTMSSEVVLATLFVLIVPTYLPNLFLNYSLRFVAPTVTSIYAYIQPVVAIIISVIMGLDRPHFDTIIFATIIFVGVGLVVGAYNKRGGPTTTS